MGERSTEKTMRGGKTRGQGKGQRRREEGGNELHPSSLGLTA